MKRFSPFVASIVLLLIAAPTTSAAIKLKPGSAFDSFKNYQPVSVGDMKTIFPEKLCIIDCDKGADSNDQETAASPTPKPTPTAKPTPTPTPAKIEHDTRERSRSKESYHQETTITYDERFEGEGDNQTNLPNQQSNQQSQSSSSSSQPSLLSGLRQQLSQIKSSLSKLF